MLGPRPRQQGRQFPGEAGMAMGTHSMYGEGAGRTGDQGGKKEAELRSL